MAKASKKTATTKKKAVTAKKKTAAKKKAATTTKKKAASSSKAAPATRKTAGRKKAAKSAARKRVEPTEAQIRERARAIWIERGRPAGQDELNWLEAERQLREEG